MLNNIEVETTLAIVSEPPEETVSEIAELTHIDQYELKHKSVLEINDLYLDLEGSVLRSFGFGLRIRTAGGVELLTLKGKPQNLPGGGIRRDELELPWSSEALSAIVTRLREYGVPLRHTEPDVDLRDALSVLSEMGFLVDQRRSTTRRPRDVMLSGDPTNTIAELVVDSVEYHFETEIVRHHEIEIEQKGDGTVKDIQVVTRGLLSCYPYVLREWHFGKRSTGRVAAALLAELGAGRVKSASGNLLPEAYDLIRERLD